MNRVAIALAAAIAALALSGSGSARNVSYRAWAATAIPQARLEIAGTGPRVSALSPDGRVAVVGDPRGVYLFRTSFEGSWDSFSRPAARLRLPHTALVNLTAMATSSDGTTVVVATGAVGNNPSAVYVFHVSSPRAWTSPATPTAKLTNAADPTGFGSGVALSSDGTTALAGDLGGADVFHVRTADSWRDSSRPTATLVADPVGAEAGGLSIAVALSADGTTALIGATSLDTFFGAAYVFRAAAADAWVSSTTPDAVLTDGLASLFGDGFGGVVALSPDGMTALVGAPNLALGPAGAAYFFHVRSPDAWTSTANPDAMAGQLGSRKSGRVLGWSVALSEEGTALVGDPSVLGKAGAADVFHIAGPNESWGVGTDSRARLTNAASPPGDLLGASVGLSSDGTTALVSSVRATFIFTEQSGARGGMHCYVPYLDGRAVPAAKRAIKSTHCRVGTVSRVRASRAGTKRVVSQTPKPGERLAKDATINLRVR
jgi:hypothetical protein